MTELITGYDKKELEEFISACEYPAQIVVTSGPNPVHFYCTNLQEVIEQVQEVIDEAPDKVLDKRFLQWCPTAKEEGFQLYDDFKNRSFVLKVDIDEGTPGDNLIEKIGNAIASSCDAWLKKVVEEMDESLRARSHIIDDLERWGMYNFGPDSLEKNAAFYTTPYMSATLSCNGKEVELHLPPYGNFLSLKEEYEALFKGVRFKS